MEAQEVLRELKVNTMLSAQAVERTLELERLPATHPEQGWLTSEVVAAGIAPRSKHIAEWCLLRKRRVLEVLVLGASVTAGCGAHAPSPHCHPSG